VRCSLRRVARCLVLIKALLAFDSVIYAAHAQDTIPLLVRVEDRGRIGPRNRIVTRDPHTGADREIYRSKGGIPYQVTVSPDGRYLSFIEVVSQTGAGKRRLTVIDFSGRIVGLLGESSIYAVRGIREYVWCCGSNTLAIIAGGLSDEGGTGESTTLPHGLSLVDSRTGGATPIAGLRFPLQIYWAAFDSSLYIKDSPDAAPGARGPTTYPVYRYHAPSGTLTRTTRHGVYFSPDGTYYFDTGVSEASGNLQLYRAADDREVTDKLAVPRHHLGPEGGWMPGADHALVFVEKPPPQPPKPPQRGDTAFLAPGPPRPRVYPDRWNLMVDAETGRVIERFQGDIAVGWKTNAAALPVEGQKGVELVRPRHR
jgi:hypothetical protein